MVPSENSKRGESCAFPSHGSGLFAFLDLDHLAAVVLAAILARAVGHDQRTAVLAGNEAGSFELPVSGAPLVASRPGYFTLGDCHVYTSWSAAVSSSLYFFLFIQKLLQYSHSWIAGTGAGAGAVVEVLAARRTQALAVLPAEEFAVHAEDKDGTENLREIRTVVLLSLIHISEPTRPY